MCRDEDCGCGCGGERYWGHHAGYGHHWHHMGYGFSLMSIEEEVKMLEEMKGALEKLVETVNKRLEVMKR